MPDPEECATTDLERHSSLHSDEKSCKISDDLIQLASASDHADHVARIFGGFELDFELSFREWQWAGKAGI
jgi:hypothetical protein